MNLILNVDSFCHLPSIITIRKKRILVVGIYANKHVLNKLFSKENVKLCTNNVINEYRHCILSLLVLKIIYFDSSLLYSDRQL